MCLFLNHFLFISKKEVRWIENGNISDVRIIDSLPPAHILLVIESTTWALALIKNQILISRFISRHSNTELHQLGFDVSFNKISEIYLKRSDVLRSLYSAYLPWASRTTNSGPELWNSCLNMFMFFSGKMELVRLSVISQWGSPSLDWDLYELFALILPFGVISNPLCSRQAVQPRSHFLQPPGIVLLCQIKEMSALLLPKPLH